MSLFLLFFKKISYFFTNTGPSKDLPYIMLTPVFKHSYVNAYLVTKMWFLKVIFNLGFFPFDSLKLGKNLSCFKYFFMS